MTPRPVLLAALAWQTASLVNIGSPADPEHMRYERAVQLPAGTVAGGGAGNVACIVLDAPVFAHAALPGAADLRLFRAGPGTLGQAEVPYLLTESGPEPVDAAAIRPSRIHRTDRDLQFDLTMPPRAFSELRLQMNPRGLDQDFVGTVRVSAEGTSKVPAERTSLGSFGIFDLHREGLGRWTTLLLAESTAPVLHLTLALRTPAGQPIADPPLTLVESVDVPPSRERQTVYTPVATTTSFAQRGDATVGTLQVPAHVPVEELQVMPAPGPGPDFARPVAVTARTADDPFNEPEILDAGTLQTTRIPSGDPRLNPIDVEERNFPSTLGATLAHPATVEIAVANGPGPMLRLASATLEMRERRLCFNAAANAAKGTIYTLRYGDPALLAPLYAEGPETAAAARTASLGPERRNPQWTPRRDGRPFFDRHPELFWMVVLLCSGTMGGTALGFVQQRREDAGDWS